MLNCAPGLSQKEWLTVAVDLVVRLNEVLGLLDNAVERLNNTGTLFRMEVHGPRPTYLLISSCKQFCMTARARIYMETSKLPILPKTQVTKFRSLTMESLQEFLRIHKTFDQEGDYRHLDYFVVVSRRSSDVFDDADGRDSHVGIISVTSTRPFTQTTSIGARSRRSLTKLLCWRVC